MTPDRFWFVLVTVGLLVVALVFLGIRSEGRDGLPGEAGPRGSLGPQGPPGPWAPTVGPTGPRGPSGPLGSKGPSGVQGPQAPGIQWASVNVTTTGPGDSPTGAVVPIGGNPSFLADLDIVLPDTWPFLVGNVSTSFSTGPQGFVTIDVAPAAPYAVDFAFDIVAGPTGPQGPQGPAGPSGSQGPQGPQGQPASGPSGASGPIGPQGDQGDFGLLRPYVYWAITATNGAQDSVDLVPLGGASLVPSPTSTIPWAAITRPAPGGTAVAEMLQGPSGLFFVIQSTGLYKVNLQLAQAPVNNREPQAPYIQAVVHNTQWADPQVLPFVPTRIGQGSALPNGYNLSVLQFVWLFQAGQAVSFQALESPESGANDPIGVLGGLGPLLTVLSFTQLGAPAGAVPL